MLIYRVPFNLHHDNVIDLRPRFNAQNVTLATAILSLTYLMSKVTTKLCSAGSVLSFGSNLVGTALASAMSSYGCRKFQSHEIESIQFAGIMNYQTDLRLSKATVTFTINSKY